MQEKVAAHKSLRFKFVLASIVVEITMLGLLLGNSLRLMNATLEEQTQAKLQALSPLLDGALSGRLFERDHAAVMEILGKLMSGGHANFAYLAVYDQRGRLYASLGEVDPARMPALDTDVTASLKDLVYDTASPLMLASERIGEVRYGLSLQSLVAARDTLLTQGAVIAAAEVLLSLLLLGLAASLLTRHLRELSLATRRVADGQYDLPIDTRGNDEIGVLARSFKAMTEAIRERISALHQSEQALQAEKERAVVTLYSIGDGVITTDTHGLVQTINPVAEGLTGWHDAAARGRPITDVYRVRDEETGLDLENAVLQAIAERTVITRTGRAILCDAQGQERAIEETAAPILDRSGQLIGAVLVFRDVSEMRELHRRLAYQATHDALTGLINRFEFERRLAQLLEAGTWRDSHAMFYLDLDDFKVVNDTCGHYAGDEMLRELARLIRSKVRETDVVGRLGGDEFGVLLSNIQMDAARQLASSLRDAIQSYHFVWDNRSFDVGVSIGVVPVLPGTGDSASVLSAADVACYVAKDRGRNQIHVHELGDFEHARRRGEMQWSTQVVAALRENRFVLYHQRIVPICAQDAAGHHEILIRMLDKDGTVIGPGKFLGAAERYRHMVELDLYVLSRVLAYMEDPTAEGLQRLSVNLSGQSLGSTEFLDRVKEMLRRSRVDLTRLCFEVTETAAVSNWNRALGFMRELHAMGCKFALDDFGSGLSSFAYLKTLPVDYLKIDGAFVRNMGLDRNDRAIVAAVQNLAQMFGLKTVAEYVESPELVSQLREIGVDYGQGYAFHSPEPLPHLLAEIARESPQPALAGSGLAAG